MFISCTDYTINDEVLWLHCGLSRNWLEEAYLVIENDDYIWVIERDLSKLQARYWSRKGDIILKNVCVCVCVLNPFSCVWLSSTLWTVACQAPLSMGFFRQEYWNGLPCPLPGDLLNPGTEPASLKSPALAGRFFTSSATKNGRTLIGI